MFPVIKDSADPKADVRKRLSVNVIPGTYLIQISFSSPSAIEAAEVVNQVVSAFVQQSGEFNTGMYHSLIKRYDSYLEKLYRDTVDKQGELIAIAERIDRQACPRRPKNPIPRKAMLQSVDHAQTSSKCRSFVTS